ncbi:MAG: hypothetical protein AAF557_21485 [Pseudomonadota bacterium]
MKYSALAFLGVLLATGPAFAGFEVEEPTTASQEVEMELVNTVRVGGVSLGDNVSEHEIGVSYGALEFFEIGIAFEIENERGETVSPGGFEIHSKLAIFGGETEPGGQLFDMAIYSEFSFNFDDDDDRTFAVGPIFGFNVDPVTIITNSFFVIPLADDTENTGFEYAVGAMYDVNDSVAVGFEAHGEVDSIFVGAPSLSDQEHYLGPAIQLSFEPEEDREVGLRLGSFFGLTDATADLGLSANLELGF